MNVRELLSKASPFLSNTTNFDEVVHPPNKPKVLIGVAAFQGVVPQVQEDFFQFAFACGRYNSDYDFFIKIVIKREQFRARNNIVDLAIVNGCDYLLMLDDDMVIPADLFRRMVKHDVDVCGALYYQRGGAFHPVIMKQKPGIDGFMSADFIDHHDPMITNPGLYEFEGVIGGGCMLFKTDVFRKLEQPYFWIDGIVGTDVHVCMKLMDAKIKIHVDTSIELGHVGEAHIISSRTIPAYNKEIGKVNEEFWGDLRAYFNVDDNQMQTLLIRATEGTQRKEKWEAEPRDTWEQVRKFYQSYGDWQILNLAAYNLHFDEVRAWVINDIEKIVKPGAIIIDYGCGLGYVSVPLSKKGYHVHTFDIINTPTMEFLEDRANKHDLVLWTNELSDPIPLPKKTESFPTKKIRSIEFHDDWGCADVVLLISVFDHLFDPIGVLEWATRNTKPESYIVCDSWRGIAMEKEPQHLMKFDTKTILKHFRRLGWEQVPENPFLFKKVAV